MPANPLAGLTPEQIQALPPAVLQAMLNPATATASGSASDALPDLDSAEESGNPRLPEGVFDLEIGGMSRWMSEDASRPIVPIFGCEFKVYNIVSQSEPRQPSEKDENPPPGPVKIGDARRWTANVENKVGPGGKQSVNKNAFRIRELMQAALRFVPSSKEADTAVGPDGKAISWNDVAKEGMSEENPLAGRRVRATVTRIITQRGKGYAMYVPTFSLPGDVEARTSNKVESF